MNTQTNNNELVIRMTVSHNEVTDNYSVMSKPSVLKVGINKLSVWNEVKAFNPNIIYSWAQQIWDMKYPNTFGKVINVEVI